MNNYRTFVYKYFFEKNIVHKCTIKIFAQKNVKKQVFTSKNKCCASFCTKNIFQK